MYFAIWSLIIGVLLVTMVLSGTLLRRLPLSTAMLYLAAGLGLGPAGLALMAPDPFAYSVILERSAEIAVLISLFAVGLKLGLPLSDKGWRLPVRLAIVSMTITVALVAAILLGAILAPTDPVLASDVQVLGASDRDRLRLSLTGEGGLSDGAAFPFVMLPDVRDQPRPASLAGGRAHRAHAHHGGGLHRAARDLGDAVDESLRAQERAALVRMDPARPMARGGPAVMIASCHSKGRLGMEGV